MTKFEAFMQFLRDEFDKLVLVALVLFHGAMAVWLAIMGHNDLAAWFQRAIDGFSGALIAILTGRLTKREVVANG